MAYFLDLTDPALAIPVLEASGIPVKKLVATDQGLDNHTFLLNDEFIVRFPRARWFRMDAERWVLDAIAGKTTLQVPAIELASTGEWPFIGHRLIPGVKLSTVWPSLSPARRTGVVDQMGQFFAELHQAVDPQEALSAGIPLEGSKTRCDDIKAWSDAPAEWKPFLAECVLRAESSTSSSDLRLLHLDAHADNIIYDPDRQRVVGVIDFGDVVVGDPHAEIAIGGFIDYEILDELAAAYAKYSGVDLDRQRVWDLYLIASASDIARQTYDCTPDVERCFEVWRSGRWPRSLEEIA